MTAWEVAEGGTEEDFSGAKSFLEWDPPPPSQYHPLLSSCGEKMDGGGRAGTDHSGMMDLGPNQKPPGSSRAMGRSERSASQGRWVSKGQGQGVSLGV